MEHPDLMNELARARIETLRRDGERIRFGRRAKSPRRPLPRPEVTER